MVVRASSNRTLCAAPATNSSGGLEAARPEAADSNNKMGAANGYVR